MQPPATAEMTRTSTFAPRPTSPPSLAECFRIGLAGARANWVPALVLPAFAGLLVASYFLSAEVRAALEGVTRLRQELGLWGALLGTGLFGGLIPSLYLACTSPRDQRPSLAAGAFLTVFWALRGLDVDAFYRFQSWLFGTGSDALTLACKVALDQAFYTVVFAIPVTALAYAYKDAGFRLAPVLADLRPAWYRRRVLPLLISNLCVWVPTCALVYSLPLPLQLPLFNLVLCFFTLILAHIARHTHHATTTAQAPSADAQR